MPAPRTVSRRGANENPARHRAGAETARYFTTSAPALQTAAS
jgi:hypothetical protein